VTDIWTQFDGAAMMQQLRGQPALGGVSRPVGRVLCVRHLGQRRCTWHVA
jgi:hypothetical protein